MTKLYVYIDRNMRHDDGLHRIVTDEKLLLPLSGFSNDTQGADMSDLVYLAQRPHVEWRGEEAVAKLAYIKMMDLQPHD